MDCEITIAMASVLIAWVSDADIEAAGPSKVLDSRIHRVVADEFYANVILLATQSKKAVRQYRKWLSQEVGTPIELDRVKLNSDLDYAEVMEVTGVALENARLRLDEEEIEWSFLLGSESPILDAVLIQLAQSHGAELLHWSMKEGLKVVESRPEVASSKEESAFAASKGHELVTSGPVMEGLSKRALKLAALNVPVLIHGEIGTGRELLAYAIHGASNRKDSGFIVVDCDTSDVVDLDAQLLGEGGALWLRSTVFLESVDALSTALQARLTRVLRDGKLGNRVLRARVIASTEKTPPELLNAIRIDLFHLLAVGCVYVPPLRERVEEILNLSEIILKKTNSELGSKATISNAAKELLLAFHWPGNLRELEGTLRRAAVLADGEIQVEDLEASLIAPSRKVREDSKNSSHEVVLGARSLQEVLDDQARQIILNTLSQNDGNKSKTADILGISSYQTLTNWMKRLGIS